MTPSTSRSVCARRIYAFASRASRHRSRVTTRASSLDAASVRDACGYDAQSKGSELVARVLTLAAIRIVMSQSDGFGNECSEDVNQSSTTAGLLRALTTTPPRGNGSEFLEYLLTHDDPAMRAAAIRIIEVRRTYAESGDFDWDVMAKHCKEDVDGFRRTVLNEHATKSLRNSE